MWTHFLICRFFRFYLGWFFLFLRVFILIRVSGSFLFFNLSCLILSYVFLRCNCRLFWLPWIYKLRLFLFLLLFLLLFLFFFSFFLINNSITFIGIFLWRQLSVSLSFCCLFDLNSRLLMCGTKFISFNFMLLLLSHCWDNESIRSWLFVNFSWTPRSLIPNWSFSNWRLLNTTIFSRRISSEVSL